MLIACIMLAGERRALVPSPSTVPPVYRVDFLCFLVFFVCSESYFLQYSSEKSQSWQECGQVTPHHNCMVKIY